MKGRLVFVASLAVAGAAAAQPVVKQIPKPAPVTAVPVKVNVDKNAVRPEPPLPRAASVVKVDVRPAPLVASVRAGAAIAVKRPGMGVQRDTRTRPPNLSQTAEPSGQPAVAAAANDVYVAWTEGAGRGAILLAHSPDAGASFDAPINLSGTTGVAHHARIVTNAQGVHAVWIEDTSAGARLFASSSRDRGATFSPPRAIATPTITDPEVALAIAGNDAFAAFAGSAGGTQVLQLVNVTSGATTELARGWPLRAPSLAVHGKQIAAAWEYDALGDWDVYLKVSEDLGRTFGGPTVTVRGKEVTILSNWGDQTHPAVSYDDGGGLLLTYESKYPTKRVHHVDSEFYATTADFMAERRDSSGITALSGIYTYPANDPTFDYERRPDAACTTARCYGIAPTAITVGNGRLEARMIVWNTQRDAVANAVGGLGRSPRIAATPDGYLATWVEGADNAGEVVAVRKNADYAGFALSANAGNSSAPEVAVASTNYVVVWVDTTPGNADIFFQTVPVR